ncbi:hypothetical protein L1987_46929 [Smallanthus sonchifolius]|uniref:Uncharacterized protein n=1 Tax=Smallanthus sonchifolius TaxID=185202 RepID=A0ACB9G186_9ASTR|nr:hypothetical protein L1987_46929 [Smallanthus sonchifolius]
MSNPHRKYFKLVKSEARHNRHEIAIKSLLANVKVEISPPSTTVHVKQERLAKKPLKLEIPSTLKLEGSIPKDLPPQSESAIKSLPGNVKVEIPPPSNSVHVKQEPLDKKSLKLKIPSTLNFEGAIPKDLPPLDVLNYDFSQHSTLTNPTNYLFCNITDPLDENSKSVDSVESIGTLVRWANHNPWEDELSSDSDYNPWEDEFNVVSD